MNDIKGQGKVFYDRQPVKNFEDLVNKYDTKDFASPSRSTVPLLSLFKDAWRVLREVLQSFDIPAEATLHFEYTVDGPLGKGRPSHTDLMIRSERSQLALEAKWTESRYETVSKWIRKPPDGDTHQPSNEPDPDNRRKRLAGWLELLQPYASRPLHVEDFSDTVYQMVHRAASACAETKHPQLAYLLFTPLPDGKQAHSEHYYTDLANLHQLLGAPSKFRFHVIELQLVPTNTFRRIEHLPKRSLETVRTVRNALTTGGLFEFEEFKLRTVTESSSSTR